MILTTVRAIRKVVLSVLLGILAACAPMEPSQKQGASLQDSAAGLGSLITQIHEDMLLRRKMDRFAEVSAANYVIMIPGGRIETRQENIDGATNFNCQSVKFSNVSVRAYGTSAVVTGRWSVVGAS